MIMSKVSAEAWLEGQKKSKERFNKEAYNKNIEVEKTDEEE